MLHTTGPHISEEVDSMVRDLLVEDAKYDGHENRSTHREHLVRCVLVKMPDEDCWAFSRNISFAGIGLITPQEIPSGITATLEIERLDGETQRVLATSRWSCKYGKNWFMSGWQFVNVR